MSVILYEKAKFERIALSLKMLGTDLACVFGYPKGWETNMDGIIDDFVRRIADANTDAYNNRYDEKQEKKNMETLEWQPQYTSFELIKSLKGVLYNIAEAENEKVERELEDVIYFLMSQELEKIPAYEQAEGW